MWQTSGAGGLGRQWASWVSSHYNGSAVVGLVDGRGEHEFRPESCPWFSRWEISAWAKSSVGFVLGFWSKTSSHPGKLTRIRKTSSFRSVRQVIKTRVRLRDAKQKQLGYSNWVAGYLNWTNCRSPDRCTKASFFLLSGRGFNLWVFGHIAHWKEEVNFETWNPGGG